MKRYFVLVLVLCFIPICSFAAGNVNDFQGAAIALGADQLDEKNAMSGGAFTKFNQDGCSVSFESNGGNITTAIIEGDGYNFLAYCCATMYVFDKNGDQTANMGEFLKTYLLAKNAEEYAYGKMSNGVIFFITYENGEYSFMVTE